MIFRCLTVSRAICIAPNFVLWYIYHRKFSTNFNNKNNNHTNNKILNHKRITNNSNISGQIKRVIQFQVSWSTTFELRLRRQQSAVFTTSSTVASISALIWFQQHSTILTAYYFSLNSTTLSPLEQRQP